ncbi:MAG: DUF885 domain-containing protein [Gemmatimonadales bacterium]
MTRPLLSWAALAVLAPALPAQQARVDSIASAYWQAQLDRYPEMATEDGFPGARNGRLVDLTPAAFDAYDARLRDLERAAATVDGGALTPLGQVTLQMLQESLASDLSQRVCRTELWSVDQQRGLQVTLPDLAAVQPTATSEERALFLARWRGIGDLIDQQVLDLRAGLAAGYSAPRIDVTRVIDQLGHLVAAPLDSDPLLPAAARSDAPNRDDRWAGQVRAEVADVIVPSFRRYLEFLREVYLSRARSSPGVTANPDGAACYRARIHAETTLDLGADSIHAIGLADVAATRQEMLTLAQKSFRTSNLDSLLPAMRADTALAFRTGDEVLAAAQAAVERVRSHLPALFGRLPAEQVAVVPMPAYEAADAPSAYYYPGTGDGSRPGRFLVNTSSPRSRPRYTIEALTYHEAIPGHHLQISLAQRLPLPDFMRYGGTTAFTEGWALYAERLADEQGFYSDDLQRMGMLFFRSWRACRLVVDTGLHALGWSRDSAIAYLSANTGLSRADVENEVDRYIADPGQALAYRLGERQILALRAEAEARLGPRFDLKAFHDAVLADGAVSLPILHNNIESWITAQGR